MKSVKQSVQTAMNLTCLSLRIEAEEEKELRARGGRQRAVLWLELLVDRRKASFGLFSLFESVPTTSINKGRRVIAK